MQHNEGWTSSPDVSLDTSSRLQAKQISTSAGFYGSVGLTSVSNILVNTETYFSVVKKQTFCYFLFAVFAAFLWPLAGLLAFPVSWLAVYTRSKIVHMASLLMAMGFLIGGAIESGTWILMLVQRCPQKDGQPCLDASSLLSVEQLLGLGVRPGPPVVALLLLTIIYCWVYHETAHDLERFKRQTMNLWTKDHHQRGMHFLLPETQVQHIQEVLHEQTELPQSPRLVSMFPSLSLSEGSSPRPVLGKDEDEDDESPVRRVSSVSMGTKVGLEDMVRLLELVPGWTANMPTCHDHRSRICGETRGLYSLLKQSQREADERGLWSLDLFLVREQYLESEGMTLPRGVLMVFHQLTDMILVILSGYRSNPLAAVGLCFLAALRALCPQIFDSVMHSHPLIPGDMPSAVFFVVSTTESFFISVLWLSLFYIVLMDYRRNIIQILILSATIDPRKRVRYSEDYLMGFDYWSSPEEGAQVLAKLPLINLQSASNVAAFWRLREYVDLDRHNERLAISVFLEILIIWCACCFAFTMMYILKTGKLPALMAVVLFDFIVCGTMMIFALQFTLKVKELKFHHKKIFADALYHLAQAMASLDDGPSQETEERRKDMVTAKKLLKSYYEMVSESDGDRILLGTAVTPNTLISATITLIGAVGTLLTELSIRGHVEIPDIITPTVLLSKPAVSSALHFFSKVAQH